MLKTQSEPNGSCCRETGKWGSGRLREAMRRVAQIIPISCLVASAQEVRSSWPLKIGLIALRGMATQTTRNELSEPPKMVIQSRLTENAAIPSFRDLGILTGSHCDVVVRITLCTNEGTTG